MNKKLQDNKFAFVLMSVVALAISIFGLIANSIYFEYAGYSVGMACTVLLFALLCLIYSQMNKEVKKRTIDMFFMSLFVVVIYAIITLLVDISRISIVGVTGFSAMGIAVLVFVGIFWAITVWQVVRLVLEIFGIKMKRYEDLLEGKNPFKGLFKKKEKGMDIEEIAANIEESLRSEERGQDLEEKENTAKVVATEDIATVEKEVKESEAEKAEAVIEVEEDKKKIK